jgi:sortase (surface protein transpeptidase)
MDRRLDRQAEGRHKSTGDEAPLSLLLVVVSVLVLLGYFVQGDYAGAPMAAATSSVAFEEGSAPAAVASAATTTTVAIHPVREPRRIVIPSIEVDSPVVPVGLLKNGDMETPHYGNAGWYSLGPAPGEPGPAVMLAHVDSTRHPDVFYRLKEVKPGDEIQVYGADNDPAVFAVDSVEQQLKAELPRERIWDYTSEPVIRLITCGGEYDRKWGHYLSNVIVYGHLIR